MRGMDSRKKAEIGNYVTVVHDSGQTHCAYLEQINEKEILLRFGHGKKLVVLRSLIESISVWDYDGTGGSIYACGADDKTWWPAFL